MAAESHRHRKNSRTRRSLEGCRSAEAKGLDQGGECSLTRFDSCSHFQGGAEEVRELARPGWPPNYADRVPGQAEARGKHNEAQHEHTLRAAIVKELAPTGLRRLPLCRRAKEMTTLRYINTRLALGSRQASRCTASVVATSSRLLGRVPSLP